MREIIESILLVVAVVLIYALGVWTGGDDCNEARQVIEVFMQCSNSGVCTFTTDDVWEYKHAVNVLENCVREW